jgi:hypothetical protein
MSRVLDSRGRVHRFDAAELGGFFGAVKVRRARVWVVDGDGEEFQKAPRGLAVGTAIALAARRVSSAGSDPNSTGRPPRSEMPRIETRQEWQESRFFRH